MTKMSLVLRLSKMEIETVVQYLDNFGYVLLILYLDSNGN